MDPVPSPAEPVTEQELHALLDGRLSGPQRQVLEARLARDPAVAATYQAWQQQRVALRGLHEAVLTEPVPALLVAAAGQAAHAQQQVDGWWRWGGVAAGVLCAFGLGWTAHGQFGRVVGPALSAISGAPGAAGRAREFVHQASLAHQVYAPEIRHPVEVTAAQQEHLVQWLSKRLQRPLKVPDLTAQGYELVGGRLLPGADGARAQFMFQDRSGERVTLYLGAMKEPSAPAAAQPGRAPSPPGADRRETAFSFSSDGPVPGFYWVEQGFGYALAGNLPRDKLMALAQAVYQQL